MLLIEQIIIAQGRRRDWVANQLGVSPTMLTRMLQGQRRWREGTQQAAAQVLGWTGSLEELFAPVGNGTERVVAQIAALRRAYKAGNITWAEYQEIAEVLKARA